MDVALQNLMGGLESIHGVKEGGLKVMLKNAFEEVHLLVNMINRLSCTDPFSGNESFQDIHRSIFA